jgi:hypothetical protein
MRAGIMRVMANKALAKRQKMTIRLEPSQKAPRNPFALAAKQRVAGPHQKSISARRQLEKQRLQKKLHATPDDESGED